MNFITKNSLISIMILSISYWLMPIIRKLPRPDLPQIQLSSLVGNRTTVSDGGSSCKVLRGGHEGEGSSLKFCEDLVDWKQSGLAIISCDPGRFDWNTVMGPLNDPKPHGSIYVYDYSRPGSDRKITDKTDTKRSNNIYRLDLNGFPYSSKDFHPLGIEIFDLENGLARLFVVNHRRSRSVIEIFDLSVKTIVTEGSKIGKSSDDDSGRVVECKWVRTISNRLIRTPNSIVALGKDSILVSNDHFFNKRFNPVLHLLETWLALPGGSVIEIKIEDQEGSSGESQNLGGKENWTDCEGDDEEERRGVEALTVVNRISFANGISLSPDGSILAISSSMTHSIRFYDRLKTLEDQSPSSSKVKRFNNRFDYLGSYSSLKFAPDNIAFNDQNSQLIVTGHPHGLSLVKFVRRGDPKKTEPSKLPGSWVSVLNFEKRTLEESKEVEKGKVGEDGVMMKKKKFRIDGFEEFELFRDDGKFFKTSSTALIISKKPNRFENHSISSSISSDEVDERNESEKFLIVSGLYEVGLLECQITP